MKKTAKKVIVKKAVTPEKSKTKKGLTLGKKMSYIGIFAIFFFGVISLVTTRQMTKNILPQEGVTTYSLPVYTPTLLSDASEKIAKTPVPEAYETAAVQKPEAVTQKEQPAAPVAKVIEPFYITLPEEKDIIIPFSQDTLLFSKTMQDWRTHNGMDIKGDLGDAVAAVAPGTVSKTYLDAQMGHTIVITHEGGFETVYQNLASTEMVKEGDIVTKGQVIAAIGNTAKSELLEEAHLHFALKKEEKFVNPKDYEMPS